MLSDGRAGNDRQALALAARLAERVERVPFTLRSPWDWLAPRWLPGAWASLPELQRAALLARPPPGLLVGCGRRAALLTRLLGAHWGRRVPCVQILDPRLSTRHWDVVVAPRHDRLQADNVVQTLGALHPVDPAWLEAGRRAHPQLGALPSPRTLLLLGGPTRAAPLRRRDAESMFALLRHWFERDGGSLMLSGSRRTPGWLRRLAEQALDSVSGPRYWPADGGDNPYAGMLGWAERIVVTADSVNMVSEAAATPVPVLIHAPRPPRGGVGELLRELTERGRIRPLKLGYRPWAVEPLQELGPTAQAVAQRLGWLSAKC